MGMHYYTKTAGYQTHFPNFQATSRYLPRFRPRQSSWSSRGSTEASRRRRRLKKFTWTYVLFSKRVRVIVDRVSEDIEIRVYSGTNITSKFTPFGIDMSANGIIEAVRSYEDTVPHLAHFGQDLRRWMNSHAPRSSLTIFSPENTCQFLRVRDE